MSLPFTGGLRSSVRTMVFAVATALLSPGAMAQTTMVVEANELPKILFGPYRVLVGDTINVAFFKTSDLNRTLRVGPDGDVYLPLVGRVRCADRTVDEVTEELAKRYGRELTDPQVTVSVVEFGNLAVYVGGEVNTPGILPYRGGLSAVQAIMNAGGFKTTASMTTVVLMRKGSTNEPRGTVINVKDILAKAKFDKDVVLAPTDVIFVPRSRIANVNLFVEQYIKNNIPIPFAFGYSFPK